MIKAKIVRSDTFYIPFGVYYWQPIRHKRFNLAMGFLCWELLIFWGVKI